MQLLRTIPYFNKPQLRKILFCQYNSGLYEMDDKQQSRREQNDFKRKNKKFVPGTVTLQVLGSGANGSPASAYLFTDQSRYLFNCGEGTQRLAHEHKTKLSRLERIFITRNTWLRLGGLPGLALTVQDAGVTDLCLHGPPDVDNILQSMKRFVILKKLQITTLDCTENKNHLFEDQVMTVKCYPIFQGSAKSSATPAIVYICKLKPKQGALNLQKCVEKGVTPGPLLGLLKNGFDITLDNGTVVKSADVSESEEQLLSFMFVDVPDEDFLPSFVHSSEVEDIDYKNMAYVIHFTPEQTIRHRLYLAFTEKFASGTKHLFLNGSSNFSGFVSAHRIQYQLNQINSKIFPLLGESHSLAFGKDSRNSKKTKLINLELEHVNCPENSSVLDDGVNVKTIQSLTNIHLRPRKGLDRTSEAHINTPELVKELQSIKEFSVLVEKLKVEIKNFENQRIVIGRKLPPYPKIVFLGTGSCIPNKTRNVSAILLQTNEESFILLDCGEGTYGQIIRYFGEQAAANILRRMKAVYISHLHADHHIGLVGILKQRLLSCGSNAHPLLLFAPKQIGPWLTFYNEQIENIDEGYKLIPNAELIEVPFIAAKHNMGVKSFSTCMVKHCPHSFGVSIVLESCEAFFNDANPLKITYSGDTMPCNDLVDLGRDSTILIHEATMEDDLIEEAKSKMHSTISEAISQGYQMNAKYIILTHFSQRYAKLPRMNTDNMKNVAIAFDNMQVTLRDLEIFYMLYPSLKALFAEQYEELEQKAMKREFKQQRKRKLL